MFLDSQGCAHIEEESDWHEAIDLSVRPVQLQKIARRLCSMVRPWQGVGTADAAASWLRSMFRTKWLSYTEDRPGGPAYDVVCPPCVTWHRGSGDCDDFSVMMVSLLRSMGCRAKVVPGWVVVDGEWEGHAWVEGEDRLGPFLIEATTGQVWRDRPREYVREKVFVPELIDPF